MHTEMGNIMRNIPSIQMMDAMARGEARAEARILSIDCACLTKH